MVQDSITHFSHPGHELVKRHYFGPSFRCDMCWEALSGAAYGCGAGCDFAIHESCAAHPQTHYCPAHPAHSLVLLQTGRDVAHTCDFCAGHCAPGAFLYRCPPCGFDMHPRCTALPLAAVRSARHPEHDLTLVVADGRSCAACRLGAGRPWYSYRCTTCNIDFHVSCAVGGDDANNVGVRHDAANSHVPPAASVRSHVPASGAAHSHVPPPGAAHSHVPAAGAAHNPVPAGAVHSHAQQQAEAAQMEAVARQLQAELLRARIQAQGAMGYANTMRNAGLDMMSLFYPMERRDRDY